MEIPETPHDPDDGHEVVLDIGSLLSLADDEVSAEDADGAGPESLDPAADLADLGEPIVGSLEEGTDEPLEDLVSEDLPESRRRRSRRGARRIVVARHRCPA